MRVAAGHISSAYGAGDLTFLGAGEEGVVFTDGRLAYKYFHYWKAGDREDRITFLQSLAGSLSGYGSLPDLLEVGWQGEHVVAVYPHEAGSAYEGGYLDGLLTLLREVRQAGIACRNIHPDNLLVTTSGLKLVDYGSDMVPVDDNEFEQMCRRALLTYRFPFRSDLKRLMTESLANPLLSELAGLNQFRRALDARAPTSLSSPAAPASASKYTSPSRDLRKWASLATGAGNKPMSPQELVTLISFALGFITCALIITATVSFISTSYTIAYRQVYKLKTRAVKSLLAVAAAGAMAIIIS